MTATTIIESLANSIRISFSKYSRDFGGTQLENLTSLIQKYGSESRQVGQPKTLTPQELSEKFKDPLFRGIRDQEALDSLARFIHTNQSTFNFLQKLDQRTVQKSCNLVPKDVQVVTQYAIRIFSKIPPPLQPTTETTAAPVQTPESVQKNPTPPGDLHKAAVHLRPSATSHSRPSSTPPATSPKEIELVSFSSRQPTFD